MKDTPNATTTFSLPITRQMHQVANQFRQVQPNQPKAKQVYLNAIAVQVVSAYLHYFGIETDLAASDSWNPAMQLLTDTADLVIPAQGKLECRPVLPTQDYCWIPPEVWNDRIGYVAVLVNAELTEATLLGFLSEVDQAETPLTELRSLDELLEHIIPAIPMTAHLSQWFQGVVELSWQHLDTLFNVPQPVLAMRGIEPDTEDIPNYMTRGKLLQVGTAGEQADVALVVELLPTEQQELQITVKLCSLQEKNVLPQDLEVMILDELGTAVMQAQSRNTDMIQLKFRALPQERFSVRVVSEAMSVTEDFVV